MHCSNCSWQKGMSRTEATFPVELTISSLLERFEGLVMPNQYRQTVMKESEAGFFGEHESPNLHDPYYTVLPYCMI